MAKLIITSEILALQSERKALEMRKEQKPEPLPPLVKALESGHFRSKGAGL